MSPKHLNFSHSCCGGEQFLYERNLGADQCYSNLSEEIQFWGWWGHHSYLSRRKSFSSFQPKMTWEQGIGWFGFRLCSSVFLMVSVISWLTPSPHWNFCLGLLAHWCVREDVESHLENTAPAWAPGRSWAMLTIKPSLLCYSCCATGCGKGMEHPSAMKQKLEGETDMSFAREMVTQLFELKEQLCVGLQSRLWSRWRQCVTRLSTTPSTVKSTALRRFCLEIKETRGVFWCKDGAFHPCPREKPRNGYLSSTACHVRLLKCHPLPVCGN